MSHAPGDAELVARSRRSDADAFGMLVERHHRMVVGVALARCGDPELAEDVAQEAFLAAWRDLGRLRDTNRVGSWVAGIARNLATNATRVRKRRRIELPVEVASVETPEEAAVAREDRELLARALAEVPEAYRDALVRYYLDGESVAQIAVAHGAREELVKQRLSRGRRALRERVVERVESALAGSRARVAGPGAVAAMAASTREAAAGSIGKVILGMAMKKVAVAVVGVLAIAGGAVWFLQASGPERNDRAPSGPSSSAPSREAPAAVAQEDAPAVAPGPRVRRFADPKQRIAMLEEIRRRHARKVGSSGGAPGEGASAPQLPAPPAIDKDYLRSAVRELIPLLSECYVEGLERDPAIAGNVMVEFTIEGDPEVGGLIGESTIDDKETTLEDAQVRECIQETMHALEIDPPESGGVVRVRYPFAFSPGID